MNEAELKKSNRIWYIWSYFSLIYIFNLTIDFNVRFPSQAGLQK